MAKVSIGALCSFNHENQDWSVFKERLEQWFLANDLETDGKSKVKRRAVLLSSLVENTYKLVRDLALPKAINSLEYDDLIKLLDDHCVPAKCGFAERNSFYIATQRSMEDLAEWAARVRGLAVNCSFPAAVINELLRDRFVLGMQPGHERDKLFTMDMNELTLSKALDTAQTIRSARQGAAQVVQEAGHGSAGAPRVELPVYKMAASARQRGPRPGPPRPAASAASTVAAGTEACAICGYNSHQAATCKFVRYRCGICGERGHLRRVCPRKKVHFVEVEVDEVGDDGKRYLICNISSENGEPMRESVLVNSVRINFEVDTGSAVTLIPENVYKSHFHTIKLNQSHTVLQSYNGSSIAILGTLTLPITYKSKTVDIQVYVIKGTGPCLLGRDFLTRFNLQIVNVNKCTDYVSSFITKYPKLFSSQLGCYKEIKVSLHVKPDSKPFFFKARQVPFALKVKVERELERLVSEGILVPVSSSEYASPIVPVLKSNGGIRICADFSVSLNKQLIIEKYPLPRIDELFSKLHGGEKFTKLDLSQAYNQLQLSEESQKLTCINTHKGLFMYTRLVFGLASSAAIFQKTLEQILGGSDGVLVFQDDILVTGSNDDEHLQRLNDVFCKLESAGLVLQPAKCEFFRQSVSYLGFIIDRNGLHKCREKVDVINNAKIPTNVTELKSFLGMVNYYRNFIKNASSVLNPLHHLLQKKLPWCWGVEHDQAVSRIKRDLVSDVTLAHFDPNATLILTVDASPAGLGAVLAQRAADGSERPVSYASRALTKAELSYSQIQKEATAIIFGVRKYHQYLYGRSTPFILKTDHKPLLSIFSPDKGIPEVTANRLQRYAIFLASYNYVIEYVTSAHNVADYLSRSVTTKTNKSYESGTSTIDTATYIHFVYSGSDRYTTLDDVARETQSDSILSQVCKCVQSGWPRGKINTDLKPYYTCRVELSVEKSCLVRGAKVVIPSKQRPGVLAELHRGHLGSNKMKADARDRFWWPGLSADIDRHVASCELCASLRPAPARAPLTPWPYPPSPWYRVHMDFLGPINNKTFLLIVDAYSKWIECFDVSTGYGTKVVVNKLCEVMSRFGLINTICTDNGTSFVSLEFKEFCAKNGIVHLTSPPYNPSSNGQAESSVKIVKKAIKTLILSGIKATDMAGKLNEFLFQYRNSVHSTTGRSPAEILFGLKLRNRLDLLNTRHPTSLDLDLDSKVMGKQSLQSDYYGGKRNVIFKVNELVLVKMYKNQKTYWVKGTVVGSEGKSVYVIQILSEDVAPGQLLRRHVNQLLKYKGEGLIPVSANKSQEEMATESKSIKAPVELPPIIMAPPSPAASQPPPAPEAAATPAPENEMRQHTEDRDSVSPPPAPRKPLRDLFIYRDYF